MNEATLPLLRPHAFFDDGSPVPRCYRCRHCLRVWKHLEDVQRCCHAEWRLEDRYIYARSGSGHSIYQVWVRQSKPQTTTIQEGKCNNAIDDFFSGDDLLYDFAGDGRATV